jgi:hypothetical protein
MRSRKWFRRRNKHLWLTKKQAKRFIELALKEPVVMKSIAIFPPQRKRSDP